MGRTFTRRYPHRGSLRSMTRRWIRRARSRAVHLNCVQEKQARSLRETERRSDGTQASCGKTQRIYGVDARDNVNATARAEPRIPMDGSAPTPLLGRGAVRRARGVGVGRILREIATKRFSSARERDASACMRRHQTFALAPALLLRDQMRFSAASAPEASLALRTSLLLLLHSSSSPPRM